jgi:predicted nucleic acid-binding protein
VSQGVTFDAGALIALERGKQRARFVFERLRERDVLITVPIVVVGEWWRGRTDSRERILAAVDVEPLTLTAVKAAGEAIAAVKGAGLVDAIVMASAASRGDIVYTSDVDDLTALQACFPEVRVLSV